MKWILVCCGCLGFLAGSRPSIAQEQRDFGGRPEAAGLVPGQTEFGGEQGGQPEREAVSTPQAVHPADGPAASTGLLPGPTPAVEQAPSAAAADRSDPSPAAKWRYRWYEGTWWYWSPSKNWYVWAVDQWIPYEQLAGSAPSNADSMESYSADSTYSSGSYPVYGGSYYGAYYPRGYRIPWWLWVYRYRNGPFIGNRYPYAGRYPNAGANPYRAGYGNYGDRSPGSTFRSPAISGDGGFRGGVRAGGGGLGGGGARGGARSFGGGMRGGFGGGGRR